MTKILLIFASLTVVSATTAVGQTMYKCQDTSGSGAVRFQQMPCSPTGGGESMAVKSIPAGAGSGISENAKNYMQERDKYWDDKSKEAAEESKRQDALRVEREKAAATREHAEAQRDTARAIWATGSRY